MGIWAKITRGWQLAGISFGIINKNKNLLVFPVLSVAAFFLIVASFIGGFAALTGDGAQASTNMDHKTELLLLFIFYFINSAVIIFFNMALIHCVFKVLSGDTVRVKDGFMFALSKIKVILTWALICATVDLVIKMIEDKHEAISSIISGLFGILWSLATFLVVPVLAYENLDVPEAMRRSTDLFKKTWGERAGAAFSFALIGWVFFLMFAITLGVFVLPRSFPLFIIALMILGGIISCIIAAAQTVFLASVYQFAAGIPVDIKNGIDYRDIFKPKE